MYNALVLAGAKGKGALEISTKVENKALIIMNNKPVIEYVIDALNTAEEIADIVVVGPKDNLYPYIGEKVKEILEEGNSVIENMERGIDFITTHLSNPKGKLLITTADIPLISSQAIDHFVGRCLEEADFYYPIMEKEHILEKYPTTKRTYVRTREGKLCGGNIMLISPKLFHHKKELVKEAFDMRKDVKKFAKVLGLKLIIKFLFRSITVADIEKKISDVLGYKVVAVETSFPEMMIDLDKPDDLKLIQECLT